VTLINLGPDEKLRGLEKVAESEHDDDEDAGS
jgi:DNA gyrase subunit A